MDKIEKLQQKIKELKNLNDNTKQLEIDCLNEKIYRIREGK